MPVKLRLGCFFCANANAVETSRNAVSPVLGWALKCLAQGHSHKKTQRIQCGSNPGPLDCKSSTLPLSHVGPSCPAKTRSLCQILKDCCVCSNGHNFNMISMKLGHNVYQLYFRLDSKLVMSGQN